MSSEAISSLPNVSRVQLASAGMPRVVDVARMTIHDIPAVMEIEQAAFPRPWPEQAYRYELTENPNAYFVVARLVNLPSASRRSQPFIPAFPSILHKLFARALPPTTQISPSRAAEAPIIGFAGMWMYVDEAHIATIATHPNWRRRGVGEHILINLLREAQRRNAANTTLEVRINNRVAQNLYKKYGFEEVGQRKAYYQDNREDALIMTIVDFSTPGFANRLDELERNLNLASQVAA